MEKSKIDTNFIMKERKGMSLDLG